MELLHRKICLILEQNIKDMSKNGLNICKICPKWERCAKDVSENGVCGLQARTIKNTAPYNEELSKNGVFYQRYV